MSSSSYYPVFVCRIDEPPTICEASTTIGEATGSEASTSEDTAKYAPVPTYHSVFCYARKNGSDNYLTFKTHDVSDGQRCCLIGARSFAVFTEYSDGSRWIQHIAQCKDPKEETSQLTNGVTTRPWPIELAILMSIMVLLL